MPALSKQQQKLFGLALAVKRGDVPKSEVSDEIKGIVDRMSEKDIEKYAKTKHKGLPNKVEMEMESLINKIDEKWSDLQEANAVSGGKVHKFITGKNLTFKGKKYPNLYFEVLGINNISKIVTLRILSPKELFGKELDVPFKTIRRGPFLKTDTSKFNEGWSDKYKRSIDCNNPKGFSQRAHCQGRKKK